MTSTPTIQRYAQDLGALMGHVGASIERANRLPPVTLPADPAWAAAHHAEMDEWRAVTAEVIALRAPAAALGVRVRAEQWAVMLAQAADTTDGGIAESDPARIAAGMEKGRHADKLAFDLSRSVQQLA